MISEEEEGGISPFIFLFIVIGDLYLMCEKA